MIHLGVIRDDRAALVHAHAEFLGRPEFQPTLPALEPPRMPNWLLALGDFLVHHWATIKWMLWASLALVALFVGYAVLRTFWPVFVRRRPKPERIPSAPDWHPTPAAARELLRAADGLASRGCYAEAVHILLLRSIEDIRAQRPRLVRPAQTSREIGLLEALPEAARQPFIGIAASAERALFAGQPIDAAEFARCRTAYEAFAFPPLWRTEASL